MLNISCVHFLSIIGMFLLAFPSFHSDGLRKNIPMISRKWMKVYLISIGNTCKTGYESFRECSDTERIYKL